ncbi:hypothetical protein CDAR_69601 [Caerostris darwini]|uniref:Uncharacterized protein n=1 Tax=Caerostris darwini TaxID=1538125 RepID=A0AAV4U0T8_9ARAC|nr:hypothetical protein CDAR_69601 [Caerostris darwini]
MLSRTKKKLLQFLISVKKYRLLNNSNGCIILQKKERKKHHRKRSILRTEINHNNFLPPPALAAPSTDRSVPGGSLTPLLGHGRMARSWTRKSKCRQ